MIPERKFPRSSNTHKHTQIVLSGGEVYIFDPNDARVLATLNNFWNIWDADGTGDISKEEFSKVAVPCIAKLLKTGGSNIELTDDQFNQMGLDAAKIKLEAAASK